MFVRWVCPCIVLHLPFVFRACLEANYSEGIENDRFAQQLLHYSLKHEPDTAFAMVAHSQGGLAALWLYTYYWSGLDALAAPNGYLIQTLGTPWLGTPIMSEAYIAIIDEYFCGYVTALSEAGALASLALVPASNQARVRYAVFYAGGDVCTSDFELLLGECTYCEEITDLLMLGSLNDGATTADKLGRWKRYRERDGVVSHRLRRVSSLKDDDEDDKRMILRIDQRTNGRACLSTNSELPMMQPRVRRGVCG